MTKCKKNQSLDSFEQHFAYLQDQLLNKQLEISKRFKGVAACCSGGPDSTALFHLLRQMTKAKKNFPLVICHVNFGLRGEESNQDERFLRALSDEFQAPIFVRNVKKNQDPRSRSKNLQNWARQIRYDFFKELISEGYIIALGHTENDVAENAIFRMARGASPLSLAGMNMWTPPYWRPLLKTPKSFVMRWLDKFELSYREDSSNQKTIYTRNIIRHKILPKLEQRHPGATHRIARLAEETEQLTKYIIQQKFEKIHRAEQIQRSEITEFPYIICKLFIADFIRRKTSPKQRLSSIVINEICKRIKDQKTKVWKIQLNKHAYLHLKNDTIEIKP